MNDAAEFVIDPNASPMPGTRLPASFAVLRPVAERIGADDDPPSLVELRGRIRSLRRLAKRAARAGARFAAKADHADAEEKRVLLDEARAAWEAGRGAAEEADALAALLPQLKAPAVRR